MSSTPDTHRNPDPTPAPPSPPGEPAPPPAPQQQQSTSPPARKTRTKQAPKPPGAAASAGPKAAAIPTGFEFGTGGHGYPRHRSKVRDLLTEEDREEYERLLADRRFTLEAAWAWLRERGYPVGRTSVERHRRDFHRRLDEIRRYAEVAHEFARLARDSGLTMTEGALGGLQQVLMEYLATAARDADMRAKLTPKDLATLNDAVGGSVGVKRQVDALVADRRKARKRTAAGGAADAAAEPDADADGPRYTGRPGFADTSQTAKIAERVRRVLGM